MNIYLQLTSQFNANRRRAILSGGQAVVLHRLAMMSKDGDWILREDEETMRHVLMVLGNYGAFYRFGAPLDLRWLAAGWSAHFEFRHDSLRVRADFVTRPPRLTGERLACLWKEQEARALPFLDLADLIETKKTNREKDYAVIGALAAELSDIDQRFQYSRSARELIELAARYPDRAADLMGQRPVLRFVAQGREVLESALDAERRGMMHANESRLMRYMAAADAWAKIWPEVAAEITGKPLAAAHQIIIQRADGVLPFNVSE